VGKHIARHILEAGYNLTVHDVIKETSIPLLEKGAKWANTPAELAGTCQVVISPLPTTRDIESVVYGENGLKSGWKNGDI
jgi:3-hydroxyisobutyrate dehydrogenase-like beta-hydroxyacid dehydrogenase